MPGAQGLSQVEGPEVDSRDAELAVLGPFTPALKSLLLYIVAAVTITGVC